MKTSISLGLLETQQNILNNAGIVVFRCVMVHSDRMYHSCSKNRKRPVTYGSVYSPHEGDQKGFQMYTNHSYLPALLEIIKLLIYSQAYSFHTAASNNTNPLQLSSMSPIHCVTDVYMQQSIRKILDISLLLEWTVIHWAGYH